MSERDERPRYAPKVTSGRRVVDISGKVFGEFTVDPVEIEDLSRETEIDPRRTKTEEEPSR